MENEVIVKNDDFHYFKKKVWAVCAIVALFVLFIWFFTVTFSVFLLILAGALIALFFNGFAYFIQHRIRLSRSISLVVSVVLTFVFLLLMLWFMEAKIQQQVSELAKTIPLTIANAKAKLTTTSLGRKILEETSSQEMSEKAYRFVSSFFNSTFGVFGDLYIVTFLGIFFTFGSGTYINGFYRLIPLTGKERAKATVERIGFTLIKWLKGQIFAMLIVFTMTAIGLSILNIPMAIALALIAGLLNFIPNFGPLIAMIPALLIGFTISNNTAILVGGLYILVQTLESNIITPSIQRKLINIPPALTILAQLFMGILSGGWGLVLATPLLAIAIVIIDETYVRRINNGLLP